MHSVKMKSGWMYPLFSMLKLLSKLQLKVIFINLKMMSSKGLIPKPSKNQKITIDAATVRNPFWIRLRSNTAVFMLFMISSRVDTHNVYIYYQ